MRSREEIGRYRDSIWLAVGRKLSIEVSWRHYLRDRGRLRPFLSIYAGRFLICLNHPRSRRTYLTKKRYKIRDHWRWLLFGGFLEVDWRPGATEHK